MEVDKEDKPVDRVIGEDGKERLYTEDIRKGVLPSRQKGRGHDDSEERDTDSRYAGSDGVFQVLDKQEVDITPGEPIKSIEGWIVIIDNIHEEAQESDLRDLFAEYGPIRNIHLNYDRRTGFSKGYALIEYEKHQEAEEAVKQSGKIQLAGKDLTVNWTFVGGKPTSATGVIHFRTNRSINRERGGDQNGGRSRRRESGGGNNNRRRSDNRG
ncbi:RNA recognition motif-containing protein RRM [Cavenderia fasciculata]|uniref:RNA recognition motif-containing protein RRM n=1 Tax=Cavenderia fasciculata TaxID=261658 RepID=F4PTU0_CACFS|nr:RNA recognition motif-containing protein RRM [Cavenderia fasciculata]EGG20919.1 RNA recognition motif-containing protein RRM [Cavenderia fasciculata]|eukprot:XP_004358769.1 RNA recognition motif-containing protein RRM [Cavenderia fasciculata]